MSDELIERYRFALNLMASDLKGMLVHVPFTTGFDMDLIPVSPGDWVCTTEEGLRALGRLDNWHRVGEVFLVICVYKDYTDAILATLRSIDSYTWNSDLGNYRSVPSELGLLADSVYGQNRADI